MVTTLTNHLAIALENARLYECSANRAMRCAERITAPSAVGTLAAGIAHEVRTRWSPSVRSSSFPIA
jgi:hypothetical protein